MGIIGQSVQNGVGHDFVWRNSRPVAQGSVAGEDNGSNGGAGINDCVEPLGGF
jgi:hypothetical protein